MMDWKSIIDNEWTLFLDRDGVINVRIIDGYVTNIEDFEYEDFRLEGYDPYKGIKAKVAV